MHPSQSKNDADGMQSSYTDCNAKFLRFESRWPNPYYRNVKFNWFGTCTGSDRREEEQIAECRQRAQEAINRRARDERNAAERRHAAAQERREMYLASDERRESSRQSMQRSRTSFSAK